MPIDPQEEKRKKAEFVKQTQGLRDNARKLNKGDKQKLKNMIETTKSVKLSDFGEIKEIIFKRVNK